MPFVLVGEFETMQDELKNTAALVGLLEQLPAPERAELSLAGESLDMDVFVREITRRHFYQPSEPFIALEDQVFDQLEAFSEIHTRHELRLFAQEANENDSNRCFCHVCTGQNMLTAIAATTAAVYRCRVTMAAGDNRREFNLLRSAYYCVNTAKAMYNYDCKNPKGRALLRRVDLNIQLLDRTLAQLSKDSRRDARKAARASSHSGNELADDSARPRLVKALVSKTLTELPVLVEARKAKHAAEQAWKAVVAINKKAAKEAANARTKRVAETPNTPSPLTKKEIKRVRASAATLIQKFARRQLSKGRVTRRYAQVRHERAAAALFCRRAAAAVLLQKRTRVFLAVRAAKQLASQKWQRDIDLAIQLSLCVDEV